MSSLAKVYDCDFKDIFTCPFCKEEYPPVKYHSCEKVDQLSTLLDRYEDEILTMDEMNAIDRLTRIYDFGIMKNNALREYWIEKGKSK